MRLWTFWRSSCSWRVRIALAYKMLDAEQISVHLQRQGGEQFQPVYKALNPMAQVPTLGLNDENGQEAWTLSQSLAIMEYLDERHPEPPILPKTQKARAQVRQVAEVINSGIQPLQNSAVLKRIESMGYDKRIWARDWIQDGLDKLETMVAGESNYDFLFSEHPTIAEFCLIPQLYNARRFGCEMSNWNRLRDVEAHCLALNAFDVSHPSQQNDAPDEVLQN